MVMILSKVSVDILGNFKLIFSGWNGIKSTETGHLLNFASAIFCYHAGRLRDSDFTILT